MTSQTLRRRVKDKGGTLGGQEIEYTFPAFEIDEFMKAPNAGEFVKKAYLQATGRIAREIKERKSGSVSADLESFEMIIARSLNYTKADIAQWLDSRDWSRIDSFAKPAELRRSLERWLPKLAMRVNEVDEQLSNKVAEKLVATLAGKPDPIAEYLFVLLTVRREQPPLDDALGL